MIPAPTVRTGSGASKSPELEIECRGYWDTLFWRVYNQTVLSGDAAASTVIEAVVDAVGQFVGAKAIDTNITQVPQKYDADRWAGDVISSIARIGDNGFNRWLAGFDAGRTFYYRQAAGVGISTE